MQIEIVKYRNGNYLVNGNIHVPNNSLNKDYQLIQEWVANGGVISPEFDNNELLINSKKRKCQLIDKQRDDKVDASYKLIRGRQEYLLSRSIRNELAWLNFVGRNVSAPWITDSNEIIEITKEEYKSIVTHLGDRDTGETIQARKRKDAVNALTNLSEIENYDINTFYE